MNTSVNYPNSIQRSGITTGEITRRRIVNIVFVIFWLLIFNGILRKWVLPEYQSILFFIRVPFVFVLYSVAIQGKVWPRTKRLLLVAYILGTASLLLVAIQFLVNNYNIQYFILASYGWSNYFLYVPMVFIIAENFSQKDVAKLLQQTLFFIVLEAPLVLLQFNSSPTSIFNTSSAMDAGDQFQSMGAALGRIRPNGFFSNPASQALFIAVSTIAVIYGWFRPKQRGLIFQPLLYIATIGLFVIVAVSGNRSAIVFTIIVLISTLIGGLIIGRTRLVKKVLVLFSILIFCFVVLWPTLFPDGYQVFISRWVDAYKAEASTFQFSFFGRALYSLYGWIYYLDGPIIGYLLGIANNAASRLSWVQLPAIANEWQGYGVWATESAWAAHLVELGIPLGLTYIAFRVLLTFWVFTKVWRGLKTQSNLLGLMIFSFSGLQILLGQITVQGDAGGFAWIFLGLCLASLQK